MLDLSMICWRPFLNDMLNHQFPLYNSIQKILNLSGPRHSLDRDPLDRDPLDRDPQTETPWTEIPLDRDTPWTEIHANRETPLDRDPQTETPWAEIPLDRDSLDRDPCKQRDPTGQRSPHNRETPFHVTCDAWLDKGPPLVNRITQMCKNITLPQTSFAGGKYTVFHYKRKAVGWIITH